MCKVLHLSKDAHKLKTLDFFMPTFPIYIPLLCRLRNENAKHVFNHNAFSVFYDSTLVHLRRKLDDKNAVFQGYALQVLFIFSFVIR